MPAGESTGRALRRIAGYLLNPPPRNRVAPELERPEAMCVEAAKR